MLPRRCLFARFAGDRHVRAFTASKQTIIRFFLGCALAGSACIASAARAGGPDAEAVTIDTTFLAKTPPVRLDKEAHDARASVVLMTAATGCSPSTALATLSIRPATF